MRKACVVPQVVDLRSPGRQEARTPSSKTTVQLGGSWCAAQEVARRLEREKSDLLMKLKGLERETEAMRRCSAKWCAEAAAHEAKRANDRKAEEGRLRELALWKDESRRRGEVASMAFEDASGRFLARSKDAKEALRMKSAYNATTQKLEGTLRKLAAADSENARLLELKHKQEQKIAKLEHALEVERKAKDLLLHAKTQKEKHICTLLKERDRLRADRRKALANTSPAPSPQPQIKKTQRKVSFFHEDQEDLPPKTPANHQKGGLAFSPTAPVVVTPNTHVVLQAASIRQLKTCLDDRDAQLAATTRALKKAQQDAYSLNVRLNNNNTNHHKATNNKTPAS